MSYNPNSTGNLLKLDGSISGAISQFASATTASYSIVWPSSQAGAPGYALINDGFGNLSWAPASSGTVTSVALADGSTTPIFVVSGSPITSVGTLTFTLGNQNANLVFAGPSTGSATQPGFRSLVSADIPPISLATGVTDTLPVANGGTGQVSSAAAFNALSPISGLGDLIVGTGPFTSAALPIGPTGYVLTVVGGTAVWGPAAVTGANTFLSNLTAPTAINQDLLPLSAGAYSLGTGSFYWANIFGLNFDVPDTGLGGVQISTGNSFGASGTTGPGVRGVGTHDLGLFTYGAFNANTNNVRIETGTPSGSGNFNTGAIYLQTGVPLGSGTRGNIKFVDGSEGTSGYIWTSTDTAGSGHWAAAPSTGANTALSNLTSTSINQSLLFNVANTYTIGSSTAYPAQVWSKNFFGEDGSGNQVYSISSQTGASLGTGGSANAGLVLGATSNNLSLLDVLLQSSNNQAGNLWLGSGLGAPSGSSGNVNIYSGNGQGSPSSTGNITVSTGIPTGGTRGKIQFKNGSEGTSGQIWTSTDTVGSGHWAAAPATGANTTLSNLTSPTAFNQDLIPAANVTQNIGSATDTVLNTYTKQVTSDASNNLTLQTQNGCTIVLTATNIIFEPNGAVVNSADWIQQAATKIHPASTGTATDIGTSALPFDHMYTINFRITDITSGNWIAHTVDPAVSNYTVVWPAANAAGSLTNNGSGTLSWAPAPTLSSLGIRSGSAAISSSATSKAITFSTALPNTSYSVTAQIVNTTDAFPQYQPVTITAVSTTGFTASWNEPTASANYVLHYQAILNA